MIPEILNKIRRLRTTVDENDYQIEIEVDGGINPTTAADVVMSGADTLVAGSAIFNNQESVADSLKRLRTSLHGTTKP